MIIMLNTSSIGTMNRKCMSPKIASLQMSMATAIARPASSPEKAPVALVLLQKIPMRNVATIGGEMYDSISW